jgi:methyl-accepting chemotaxis protein
VSVVRRFRDTRTGMKLGLGLLVVTVLTIIVGSLGLAQMTVLDKSLKLMYDRSTVRVVLLSDAREALGAAVLTGVQGGLNATSSGVDVESAQKDWKAHVATIDKAMAEYRELSTPGRATWLKTFDTSFASYQKAMPKLWTLAEGGSLSAFEGYFSSAVTPSATAATTALNKLAGLEELSVGRAIDSAQEQSDRSRLMIILVILACTVISIALAIGLGRVITVPLRRTVTVLKNLAEGKLDQKVEVDSRDEVGEMSLALRTALGSLSTAMREIGEASQVVASSSEEFRAVSGELSTASESVATIADETSGAAQDLSDTVQSATTSAGQMTESIAEISRSASQAMVIAGEAVEVAQDTSRIVGRLGTASDRISEIVKSIETIAEQTNLLSLNATIEAARSGEAGKGFAVVAGEVKELAGETANATQNVTALVTEIQSETKNAVESMERISAVIGRINSAQSTIAGAVEEQTAVTGQIVRNMAEATSGAGVISENVDKLTGQAAQTQNGATQTENSAAELACIAGNLNELVQRFRY